VWVEVFSIPVYKSATINCPVVVKWGSNPHASLMGVNGAGWSETGQFLLRKEVPLWDAAKKEKAAEKANKVVFLQKECLETGIPFLMLIITDREKILECNYGG